jgi:hypothetical protein
LARAVEPPALEEILSQPGLVRDELTADHEMEPIPLSINAFLINTGSHLVLVLGSAVNFFAPITKVYLITQVVPPVLSHRCRVRWRVARRPAAKRASKGKLKYNDNHKVHHGRADAD